jgi:hypothetical protein
MERSYTCLFLIFTSPILLFAQSHEVHNDDKHHRELNFDKGGTVEGRGGQANKPDRPERPDRPDRPEKPGQDRTITGYPEGNVSPISTAGIKRLQGLSRFMQILATLQTAHLIKEFLTLPNLKTFDRLNKIANGELKEMLNDLAKMPKQERDIASRIVDDIKNELSLEVDRPPASQDKNLRDQMLKEYELWNKFNDGLNYVQATANQTTLLMATRESFNTSPFFGAGGSTTGNISPRTTNLLTPLRMILKESDNEGLQVFSPNMTSLPDILIYPKFTLENVPCWGAKITINVYTSVYEHDPQNRDIAPIPYPNLESKEDFELLDRYDMPGLTIPHCEFWLTPNSGLFLPDFYYTASAPKEFFIVIDADKFEETEGVYDFYFYYTLTVAGVTSKPSAVYKIVHRLG